MPEDAAAERFDLDTSKPARAYSRGNRQKAALIATLASEAEALSDRVTIIRHGQLAETDTPPPG
jgi:ABC-type multidrug transport system ATPase subunit